MDLLSLRSLPEVIPHRSHGLDDERLAARCHETTTLVTAPSAAGVERLARRIHAASARAASPFERIAAATLPSDPAALTETCATLLDSARSGSLLLADVERMPDIVQERLLDTFADLQAVRPPASRVRLFAGTTVLLHRRIAAGTFSERLFYGLNTIHVMADSWDDSAEHAASLTLDAKISIPHATLV